LRFFKLVTVHLLWLNVLIFPGLAQEQPDNSAKDSVTVVQRDSILSNRKDPYFQTLEFERSNERYFKRAVIPSAALITAGVLTIEGRGFFSSLDLFNYRNETFPGFSTEADDFIMLAPLVGLYGFNLISPDNRHELGRQTLLLLASGVLTSAMVWPTKALTDIDRPNEESHAFPSGHTAYAFTIATFIDKEFRHRRPWMSVASYAIAGATGVLRVLNNAHWMSDVLAGAGVGILSVNTVYWVHSKLTKGGGRKVAIVPMVLPTGETGMSLTLKF
jgi:hypothetical protein